MKYKEDWQQAQTNFTAWWNRTAMPRPLLSIIARRDEPLAAPDPVAAPLDPEDLHLNVERQAGILRNHCRTHRYLAEAFPYLNLNIGPGSLATYLGAEPVFAWDTVWYRECAANPDDLGELAYDPDNVWWQRHLALMRQARTLAGDDFLVAIPDIIENLDILSAMRGPQNLCYDLMDDPAGVRRHVRQLDDLYFSYYDPLYEATRGEDGSSCYTAFSIWGPGRTAKVQCDFSALMSPRQFRDFVLPSLERQISLLDFSLYHLDGKDAIRHLEALMELKKLNGLQWTAGAGQPDGGHKQWHPIYDQVRRAGKALWIALYDGEAEDWIRHARNLVDRYGPTGLYLLFPEMSERDADRIMNIQW